MPHSEETLCRFSRGRDIGRAIADRIVAEKAAEGRVAIPEFEVPWPKDDPQWVGHADLWFPDERKVDEIYSSTDLSLPPVKAAQVVLYAINLDAVSAGVLVVNPATYESKYYPVKIEDDQDGPGLRRLAEELQARAVAALRGGPLPDRLNGDKDAAPGCFECQDCPFRRTCYEDWAPPPAGRLPGAEEDFARLAQIKAEASTYKLPKALEAERKEIQARLAQRMEPGSRYIEDGVEVWHTVSEGSLSLDFRSMAAAGLELPDHLRPFVKQSAGSDRFYVKGVEDR